MAEGDFHLDDLAHLAKRLPPQVLARFEPVTGLMVINMTRDGNAAAIRRYAEGTLTEADLTLIRTLNHETCHFLQCLSSGYMGHRNRALWSAFTSWRNRLTALRFLWLNTQGHARLWTLRLLFGWTGDGRTRATQMAVFMHQWNKAILIERITGGRPNSSARLTVPHFFRRLDGFRAREDEAGPEGVTTLGILEGGAVAFSVAIEPANAAPEAFAARMEAELAPLPPDYGALWRLLVARAPGRAPELILPLAAVALGYERPERALGPVMERLLASRPGTAAEAGRALFETPPKIAPAGRALRPAQHHRQRRRRARLYDRFIDVLREDPAGLDDYEVLTDPTYLNRVRSYPICSTFADGRSMAAVMEPAELAVRILIASQTLEVLGRGRETRAGERYMTGYARAVFDRLFGLAERQGPGEGG